MPDANIVSVHHRGIDERAARHSLRALTPLRTTLSVVVMFAVSACIMYAIALEYRSSDTSWAVVSLLVALGGLCLAHLTELQHELLHGHAYKNERVSRVLGFIAGVFMLSSYSHYRYQHLQHHRRLGTPQNSEFFNYPDLGYNSVFKLARASFDLSRYRQVCARIARLVAGGRLTDIEDDDTHRHARTEYLLFLGVFCLVGVASLVSGSFAILFAWLVPAMLVAEPAHFFIELPEHFGLPAHSNKDVTLNTRTIKASPFARWYTNSNNLHVEHHRFAGVPMRKCHRVSSELMGVRDEAEAMTYPTFFRSVIAGNIQPSPDSPRT